MPVNRSDVPSFIVNGNPQSKTLYESFCRRIDRSLVENWDDKPFKIGVEVFDIAAKEGLELKYIKAIIKLLINEYTKAGWIVRRSSDKKDIYISNVR